MSKAAQAAAAVAGTAEGSEALSESVDWNQQ